MASVVEAVLIECWWLEEGALASFGLDLSLMYNHFKPFNHLFASMDLNSPVLIETIYIVIIVVRVPLVFALNCRDLSAFSVH